VFYFLYFASPILIPIIAALLLSMLLAPFVGLLERVRIPRTLGSLIVVVAAVGALFGNAASLRGPAQSWLSEPQRFSRLEEKLRPVAASFEMLQYAVEQLEKATAPREGPSVQKVELTGSGLSGLLSTGIGHVASSIAAVIGLLSVSGLGGHLLKETPLSNSFPQRQKTRRTNCQKYRDRYLILSPNGRIH
jgi:predicted PurR-regulated permease PerM